MPELSTLSVGDRTPVRLYEAAQETINRYAVVSGDHNPLHTDPDFAAATPFGRPIAHGMMTLCFLSDAMEAFAGVAWARAGSLDVAFLAPVYANETVSVCLTVAEKDETRIICDAICSVGERIVLSGKAAVSLASMEGSTIGTA